MSFHYNNHITIGFAGKRKHIKLGLVAKQLESLFEAFDKKLKNCHLHFVTGLADGADLIAAGTFLEYFEQGIKENKRTCGAVLPFEKSDYLYTINNKTEFERIYSNCSQVLELDGKYEEGGAANHLLEKAYQQQGIVVGHLSDVFIAVMPKGDKGKTGGTKASLISVLALKKPVILLNLEDNKFYLYQSVEEWFGDDNELSPEQIVNSLFPEEYNTKQIEPEQIIDKGYIFLLRKKAWTWFEIFFKGKKHRVTVDNPVFYNSLHETIYKIQEELDKRSVHFQYQYRGGYILNYVLAIAAILLAITSLILFSEKACFYEHFWIYALISIGLFKLIIITALLVNTRDINTSKYNRKAIDYRYAAERLRVNYFMSILGVLRSPHPSLGNHSKKYFADYTGEAIYQGFMEAPLSKRFSAVIDKDKLIGFLQLLKNDWIGSQKEYHSSEAKRMKKMDNRLLFLPEVFSIAVLLIVSFDIVLGLLIEIIKVWKLESVHEGFIIAAPILLGATAFFPAIVNSLNGIHFQSEAHRLFIRSDFMVEELKTYSENIRQAEMTIENNKDGSDFLTVLRLMDNLAGVLIDEVAEWSLIYEKKVFEQG
jgi:hypothetical protein